MSLLPYSTAQNARYLLFFVKREIYKKRLMSPICQNIVSHTKMSLPVQKSNSLKNKLACTRAFKKKHERREISS